MLRWFKRLRATVTFLLVLLILTGGGYAAFRLGAGATPDELKQDVATGVSWVRKDEGAVTRFVRRALRPVANPSETLAAVRDGIGEMRKEVAQWTRDKRRSLTDGRTLIKEVAAQNRQQPGSMRSLLTTAQTFLGARNTLTPPTAGAIQAHFVPAGASGTVPMDEALIRLVEKADESIDCACYELDYAPLADALAAKHAAGVPVRIVTDSDYAGEAGIETLMTAGVPVVTDERSAYMHDKFCVFDGKRLWMGSANFTENSFHKSFNDAIDLVSPELAENYLTEFNEMFTGRQFGRRSPSDTPHPRVLINDIAIENYFSPEDRVQNEIIAEIAEAQHRIDFMMFSFTSEPISEAMLMRILDGVRVRGIMEKSQAANQSSRDEFLALRGAEIFIDENDATFHHKTLILDETTVITGSYNFSASAENENDENVLIIESPELAKQYLAVMDAIISP
jgi:phosphatidylserine/phosphatidylglycerophosphate/cardiolipin synthase-like enzyme